MLLYVHELLTKGTRDVHKTELGGEAIDLGGFANTVHGKDASRDISICLEAPIDPRAPEFMDLRSIAGELRCHGGCLPQ